MRVSAVQFSPHGLARSSALERLVELAELAAHEADLVVLPEMAAVGYAFTAREQVLDVSEPLDGPTFQALTKVAARHGCWLVAGFPERAGELLYNSAMVLRPDGHLETVYRKALLYEADTVWAEPGDGDYPVIETQVGSFTVGICMDLNDDAFIEHLRRARPRAVAFPTNWIDQGEPVWGYWAWRMEGTRAALVAANGYGVHGDLKLRGQSAILDGLTLLARAQADGDEVLRATLAATQG